MWLDIMMLVLLVICTGMATTAGTVVGFIIAMLLVDRLAHPTDRVKTME